MAVNSVCLHESSFFVPCARFAVLLLLESDQSASLSGNARLSAQVMLFPTEIILYYSIRLYGISWSRFGLPCAIHQAHLGLTPL